MARPEVSKTQLGQRLRAVRKHFGDAPRLEFAHTLGVADKTLANHERGDSEPDAGVLGRYREKLGVNVNWLVSGTGAMFDDPSKAPSQAVEPHLLEKLAKLAASVYRDAGIKLPGERATLEAAELYNDLASRVGNVSDTEEVDAVLPQLRYQLKKRLSEAAAEPGTGKRRA